MAGSGSLPLQLHLNAEGMALGPLAGPLLVPEGLLGQAPSGTTIFPPVAASGGQEPAFASLSFFEALSQKHWQTLAMLLQKQYKRNRARVQFC